MAETPEGKVKRKVKEELASIRSLSGGDRC
jgi:hypothetical protein